MRNRKKTESKVKTLKFSHNYSKLNNRSFTTIRRRDKYAVGEKVQVITPSKRFYAKIIEKWKAKLRDIPAGLLLRDTDMKTRREAESLLNSFYRNPIDEEEFLTIYRLQKEKK